MWYAHQPSGDQALVSEPAQKRGPIFSCPIASCRESLTLWREDARRADVKHGPFSKAEDAALLAALRGFAEQHGLDQQDLSWVRNITQVKHSAGKSRKEGAMKKVRHTREHCSVLLLRLANCLPRRALDVRCARARVRGS